MGSSRRLAYLLAQTLALHASLLRAVSAQSSDVSHRIEIGALLVRHASVALRSCRGQHAHDLRHSLRQPPQRHACCVGWRASFAPWAVRAPAWLTD